MHKFLGILIVFSLIFPPVFSSAQTACTSETAGKSRSQLEQELEACNKEIEKWQTTLDKTKQESASFARDVAALTAKINAAQANIKAKNIAITNLSKDIAVKQEKINVLDNRISRGKQAIADILRKTNDITSYSLVEVALSEKDLSEFFVDLDTYASTEEALDNLLTELGVNKAETVAEKAELDKKRQAEALARTQMEAAKKQVEVANAEKKVLLAESQGKEKTYSQVLADRQAKAAKIKAVLFPLLDSGPISFGTAVQYAKAAEKQTGVRAAFILGIFATESGKASDGTFGKVIGNCLLTNSPSRGNGKGKNTGAFFVKVMRSDNVRDDVGPFLEITQSLGLDPYSQPVSCPQSIGYGGAMGPAQFIPSTWKLMIPRLTKALGRTPSPWSPQDAFMAASFYLSDLGASGGNYTSERRAAHKYNGLGAPCGTSIYHYCNAVMKRATEIQQDIDFLDSL